MLKHLPLAILGWLVYTVLMLPLILLGFPLVAILALLDRRHPGLTIEGGTEQGSLLPLSWKQRLFWIYGNQENGIDGSFGSSAIYRPQKAGTWAEVWQIIKWSAWRNSVGNARWTRLFGMTVDPAKVHIYVSAYKGLPTAQACVATGWPSFDAWLASYIKQGPYIAWQGWRYELKFCWNPGQPDWTKRRYFWIGWRIAQQTAVTKGVGFAMQPWTKL